MKVMTVLGTRPEIIRLSRVIPRLDRFADHVVVHTGQNFDALLNDVFFEQLDLRAPDHVLRARGSFGAQAAEIIGGVEELIRTEQPDRFLVLGDTNSGLSAVVAKRMGIPVYHMEAGNRCYDDRVPEEVNRRIIDHVTDVWLPYTERSRQNLLREGIPGDRIFVTGNPIREVLRAYEDSIDGSRILETLGLDPGRYFLVTLHRAETVDVTERFDAVLAGLASISREYDATVIVSTHPRTRERLEAKSDTHAPTADVRFLSPFPFFDFVSLERNARCVVTDSGTVQEECAIFGVPNVTVRDTTERPETLECGSNVLAGVRPDAVLRCVRLALERPNNWVAPPDYLVENVAETVANLVLGVEGRAQ